ncbi:MAG: GNAT family N-acetyltransferase, partial [Deltaproteobacteria bacterium]
RAPPPDSPAWSEKETTPERAMRLIRPGRRILIGSGAAEPATLVQALATHGQHLADNDIVHLLTLGPAPYVAPELASRFRHTAFFIRMSDEEPLQRLLYELSDESRYLRFMAHKSAHPHQEMQKLVDTDYSASVALVVSEPANGDLVALARYDVEPDTGFADIAFVVRDDWQRRGIGSCLMRRMLELGRAKGVVGFTADVLPGNLGMMLVFQQSGLAVQSRFEGGVYRLSMRLVDGDVR